MKKMMMAAALALSALTAGAGMGITPAAADTNVKFRVVLGVPYYSYRAGPDYVYRSGYGWYRPGKARLSCSRAQDRVRANGYRAVDRVECGGGTYTFRGTKNGKRFTVYVNARNGSVYR
jgi:hypothetical protein